jgi:hypothetical protein
MTAVQPALDTTLNRQFAEPAEDARATRTAAALGANGMTVLRARTAQKRNASSWISSRRGHRCTRGRRGRSKLRASPTK